VFSAVNPHNDPWLVTVQMFGEMNHMTDTGLLDQKVKEFNKEVTELWDKLMALELQLVDQLEVRSHT